MDLIFALELPGSPRGKGRPRFRIIGSGMKQFTSAYTDSDTRKYEDQLRAIAALEMGRREPFDFPLSVKVEALMPIPGSWSTKKRALAADGSIAPTTKPDADNILKNLDALNKVVWRDDSIIVNLLIIKKYGLTPKLRIEVREWLSAS